MKTLFYRKPRLLILTICLILVAGLSSYQILPRQEDPELVRRFALIKVPFPGANAPRVETLVTEKIEEALSEIEEIKHFLSTTNPGIAIIKVELQDKVTADEVDDVWSRLRNKLDDVEPELPPGAEKPKFENLEAKAYALIASLVWQGKGKVNYSLLQRTARDLEQTLWQVPGTEKIDFWGQSEEEILITLAPHKLTSLGITSQEVSHQIQKSDAKIPAGQLRSRQNRLFIEVDSELNSLERIGQIPISTNRQGQVVYLRDIAEMEKTIQDPPDNISLVGGKRAITLGAYLESDLRVDLWSKDMEKKLAEYSQTLPRELELKVIFDQSRYTEQRLSSLLKNLLLGCLLVSLVLFFIMGWRSALIISLSLPLSSLAVLFGLRLMEIPIHQMSVTGLIIALGLLIDNAIVIVDEIQIRLGEGERPLAAISNSVSQLAIPLLGSTLTTTLTFLPIALMPGPAGEFVGSIAISVILALASSLFLSLTVIAALTGWSHSFSSSSKSKKWWQRGFSSEKITRIYRASLDRLFSRPLYGILLGIFLPLMGFLLSYQLKEQFFPPTERDQFHIEVELPIYSSLERTEKVAQKARKIIMNSPLVVDVHWFLGKSAPAFYYNLPTDRQNASHYGQALVQLKTSQGSRHLIHRLQRELDRRLPQARFLVRELEQGPPVPAPIELRLYGSDLDVLRRWGEKIRLLLARDSRIVHLRTSLSETMPKVELAIDEEKARLVGLNYTSISRQLNSQLEGSRGGSLLETTEELPLRVRLSNTYRQNLDKISSLNLIVSRRDSEESMRQIPLTNLAQTKLVPENSTIYRRNRKRFNTIQGYVKSGTLASEVLEKFRPQVEKMARALPPGYSYEFGGETEGRNEAVGNLLASVGVLATLMVLTLVLSFSSFRLAGLIASVGFLSVGLGLFALWVFAYPFGFMAIVGTMGLVGVAINDSIVVLAGLRENEEARAGDRQAVRDVVVRSTRHVVATTFTTMAGFTPLFLDGGGFWPPVAVSVAGGVAGATILALYYVPSVYLLLMGKDCEFLEEKKG